jgi:hypothetical protein
VDVQVSYLDRYRSTDLIALAAGEGVKLTERTLHDLPAWGLLPLATPEGRSPGKGVGRTWTRDQAMVFHIQMRVRAARGGGVRRGDLANVPVFFWLLEGEPWVPLAQARRALATWLRWYRTLSRRRAIIHTIHELERHPDVRAALKTGAMTRRDLEAESRSLPPMSELAARAAFFGKLRGPLADQVPPSEQTRRVATKESAMRDLEVGARAFGAAADDDLREVQGEYQQDIQPYIGGLRTRGGDAAVADALHTWELPAACANTFTRLGRHFQAQEETKLIRVIKEGTRTSLSLSEFLGQAAIALETTTKNTKLADQTHARRLRRQHKQKKT